jgi:hypothetical protein
VAARRRHDSRRDGGATAATKLCDTMKRNHFYGD